jgi:hypothetical protein
VDFCAIGPDGMIFKVLRNITFQNYLCKILFIQMWIQMSLITTNVKVWDVKSQIERLIMKRYIGWPMGYSSCISQWDEETNEFFYVTWKDIDWLRLPSKRMANGRFLVHFPMTWKRKCEFKCQNDGKALIGWKFYEQPPCTLTYQRLISNDTKV